MNQSSAVAVGNALRYHQNENKELFNTVIGAPTNEYDVIRTKWYIGFFSGIALLIFFAFIIKQRMKY